MCWRAGSAEIALRPADKYETRKVGPRSPKGRLWAVSHLYTPPRRRGEGLGTSLLAAAEAWARSNGYDLVLYVEPFGVDAPRVPELVRFYKNRGYTTLRRGHPVESFLMYKQCASG